MSLREVLEKLRYADKVTVRDGMEILFCGGVNQCLFIKDILPREIDNFYPEVLGGLIENLKKEK